MRFLQDEQGKILIFAGFFSHLMHIIFAVSLMSNQSYLIFRLESSKNTLQSLI
jgi:hypothetical protein